MSLLCQSSIFSQSLRLQHLTLPCQCQPFAVLYHGLTPPSRRKLLISPISLPRALHPVTRSTRQHHGSLQRLKRPTLHFRPTKSIPYLTSHHYQVPPRGTQPKQYQAPPRSLPQYTYDEQSPSVSSFTRTVLNYGSWPIIGLCIFIYLLSAYATYLADSMKTQQGRLLRTKLNQNFYLSLQNIEAGRWWNKITCTFMHHHVLHLLVNMVAFHSFLPECILLYGITGTLGIALLSQIFGVSASIYWQRMNYYSAVEARDWDSSTQEKTREWSEKTFFGKRPSEASKKMILYTANIGSCGMSGLILGCTAAIAVKNPTSSVLFFFFVPAPMWASVAAIMGFSWWAMTGWPKILDHAGHFGGTAGGLIGGILFRRLGLKFP